MSVGSEETVPSGLQIFAASTLQVKVDKASSFSIIVPITLLNASLNHQIEVPQVY